MTINIIYKNGSNEYQDFDTLKDFGQWWRKSVKFSNRTAGTVKKIETIDKAKKEIHELFDYLIDVAHNGI